MIHFLMVSCVLVAAVAVDDHDFFFDSSEHEYFSPSDHIRVTRDGGGGSGYEGGFYGGYFPTSYAQEASSELSPLLNYEYEQIRSGRAAALSSVEDSGPAVNLNADFDLGSSRESREIDGMDFGNGGSSSYSSSSGLFGGSDSGSGGRSFRSDGSSGGGGASSFYYPGLIGLGYGGGGYGSGGYGSGGYGSGGYGSSGYGSGGYGSSGYGSGESAGLGYYGSGGYGHGYD